MFFPHHDISFDGNWFLRIMVPPIVFEAALSIDKRSFTRHVVPIAIYAVVGTLMSTVLTAWVLHGGTTLLSRFCTPIPTVEALTFGALISSIDPIAVLSVLSNMGMTDTDTIYVLIFGESVSCERNPLNFSFEALHAHLSFSPFVSCPMHSFSTMGSVSYCSRLLSIFLMTTLSLTVLPSALLWFTFWSLPLDRF